MTQITTNTFAAFALITLLTVSISPSTVAQQVSNSAAVLSVSGVADVAKLDAYLTHHEDLSSTKTFEEIQQTPFEPLGAQSPNFGFSESAYWVKFTLTNDQSSQMRFNLRQDYPLIDYIDFWESDERGAWQARRTGDLLPFSSRDIEHRDFIFPVQIAANSSKTFYMRYETSGSMNISLSLYRPAALFKTISIEQLALGIYFGGFIVLLFYNGFIFYSVRDKAFTYYLLYLASYGSYFAVHNGLAFQFIWANNPTWANQSLIILLGLTLIFGLEFTRKILNTKDITPRLDPVLRVLQLVSIIGLVCGFFFPYATVIVPMAINTLVVTSLILTAGILSLLAGSRPSRYFMLAWSALITGVIIYMLKTFGLLPHNIITQNGFQLGALIEMILLSLALSTRVDELKQEAYTDPLTHLANRRVFDKRYEDEFERAARYDQPLSLLMVDIDHFKHFNDTYGHTTGDEVLTLVANALRSSTRNIDLVCRYGGEEFGIILPSTGGRDAQVMAERLRAAVEELSIGNGGVTVSIGVSCSTEHDFASSKAMFVAADAALYQAKETGRNLVVTHADMPELAQIKTG